MTIFSTPWSTFVVLCLALNTAFADVLNTEANSIPTRYAIAPPLLTTPWTNDVGTNPWPQHPRPLLYREQWKTLNGIWTYRRANAAEELITPPALPLMREVLIPSCIESALSGVMEEGARWMWFGTNFNLPADWSSSGRVLLHFEAVDYEATVFLNGKEIGSNQGGYFRFTFDITDDMRDGANDLLVAVFDPTDDSTYHIPNGKQAVNPSHIFYTPCAGIWQTVWLEHVPAQYIKSMDIAAGMHGDVVGVVHSSSSSPINVTIRVLDKTGVEIASHFTSSDRQFNFSVPSPALWTPDTPNLYNLSVTMGDDTVASYTGFRTISRGAVNGIQRPLLNGKFVFQFGTLDQGYWPDGIYLPPTLEAMVFDIKLLKDFGMNMMRKHIKIEPDLFYQACDQLGLLIIQDMPSMKATRNAHDDPPDANEQAEFERQVERMVNEHKSYPSISTWVIYNEGWGQIDRPGDHPEFRITERIRELDPTRLVNAVSGWWDNKAGDFSDNHHYAEPQCGTPFYSRASTPYDPQRIGIQGEFGGIGHVPPRENLWPVQAAIDTIEQTYEINQDLASYDYRSRVLLGLLRDQIVRFACSAAVWTQTTDVEGEVNGLVSYDRRFHRANATLWREDVLALYEAAERRA